MATSHPPFVSGRPDVVEAIGATTARMLMVAPVVRNLGPTALQIADVAGGRLDGFWQIGSDPGNLLGPSLIETEAGAIVTDVAGMPWRTTSTSFLACARALHAGLVAVLAG